MVRWRLKLNVLLSLWAMVCFVHPSLGENRGERELSEQPSHRVETDTSRHLAPSTLSLSPDTLDPFRKQILVITLSESTDKVHGDYLKNEGHSEQLVRLLEKLQGVGLKALIYDNGWFKNVSGLHRERLLQLAQGAGFPVVLSGTGSQEKANNLEAWGPHPPFHFGAAVYRGEELNYKEQRPIDKSNHWPHPHTRFQSIDIPLRYEKTPQLAMVALRQAESLGQDWADALKNIRLSYFSETQHQKLAIEKVLRPSYDPKQIEGKYVIVGKDYETLDAFRNAQNEQHNGVFLHAETLATLLYVHSQKAISGSTLQEIEITPAQSFDVPLAPTR